MEARYTSPPFPMIIEKRKHYRWGENVQDNSVLIERLRDEMRRSGYNARSLAERAGVGRSFVYDVLSGKSTSPTMNKLQAVADVLGVSIPYLLNDYANQTWDDVYAIPRLTPDAVAAPLLSYCFSKRWLTDHIAADADAMRVMYIEGDSMAPSVCHQDMVLVDSSKTRPVPSGVFVLQHDVGLLVRRVDIRQGGRLYISADNPVYQGYECASEDVVIVGRIVWVSRRI